MKKHIFSLILLSSILLILLTSCFKTPSAAEVASSYLVLFTKQDPSKLLALGMSKETASSILTNLHQNLRKEISNNLSMNGKVTLTDTQIDTIEAAYFEALANLETCAISTKEDKQSNVTVSTQCINFDEISHTAANLALDKINTQGYTDENQYLTDLTTAYIDHLVDGYKNAEPMPDEQTATFTFIKQDGLWLPEDVDSFISETSALVAYQNP